MHVPKGVLLRTLSRNKPPELIDDNSGNRFIKRSVCVPLPTPGAPTSIIRAALERDIFFRMFEIRKVSGISISSVFWRKVGGMEAKWLRTRSNGFSGRAYLEQNLEL